METKVETLEDNRVKISVTIDADTVTDRVKRQYKKFANQYNFPGFRKGKAPRPIVDNLLGKEAAVAMVTDDLVNETCPLAIDESGIYPVGKAEFDDDMPLVMDKQDFTYSFTIGVKPTPELSGYAPVEIELPEESASDIEIDAEIDTLREHYYTFADAADDTKVAYDSFIEMKVEATDDAGENIEAISKETTSYTVGSGQYPEEFDEAIIGLVKGETATVTTDVSADANMVTSVVRGKTAKVTFAVEILSVKERQLPELTDEWVKEKLGMDDVAALRQEIADEIEQAKGSYLPRMKENRVLSALSDRLLTEVPEGLVEENETQLLQDFFQQLQRQGMTLDAYIKQQGISAQQFRDDVKQQALDMTKQDLALDAWAAEAKLQVTDEDIRNEFVNSGASDPDALIADWKRNGQMHLIRQGILRQKALVDAVTLAVVKRVGPIVLDENGEPIVEAEEAAEEANEPVEVEAEVPAEAKETQEPAAEEEAAPKKVGKHAKKAEPEQE